MVLFNYFSRGVRTIIFKEKDCHFLCSPLDPPMKLSKYFDSYDMFVVVILFLMDFFFVCLWLLIYFTAIMYRF